MDLPSLITGDGTYSARISDTVGGVAADDLDILYFDGANWSMFFDASDVGVTEGAGDQDLNDFQIVDADTILLTFDNALTLGALAVDPGDIVQFDATSLGDTTAGTFSLYFDGSDVGLDDAVNEIIDALDQLTSDGTFTYDYDGRGNMWHRTSGSNVTTYTYNAADQLTGVSAPGISASYAYDADGRRVKQTVGSTVTNYLWDEASAYGDVVYEYNNSGSALASYILGGTGLISQSRSGTTNYYLQDGQGSTRALTSSGLNATVTDTYSYTAFGELQNQTGSTTNSYLYTGQQFDSLTGLYSLRARYYNPALGRFLSGDTYPVNYSNPLELNRYVYAANRPINLSDPSGKVAIIDFAIRSIAIGAATGAVLGLGQTLACGGNLFINVWLGMQGGAAFGALLAYNPGLALGGGVLLAAHGALTAIQDIEVHGGNRCNVFKAVTSMLMVAFSAGGLAGLRNQISGVSNETGSASTGEGTLPPKSMINGSLPKASENEVILSLNRQTAPAPSDTQFQLWILGRRAYWYMEWQMMKLCDVDPTNITSFAKGFEQAMGRASRINFDITGLDIQRAWLEGSKGLQLVELRNGRMGAKNVTDFEFYQIMTHPEWLGKTDFFYWENGVLKWFNVHGSGEIDPVPSP